MNSKDTAGDESIDANALSRGLPTNLATSSTSTTADVGGDGAVAASDMLVSQDNRGKGHHPTPKKRKASPVRSRRAKHDIKSNASPAGESQAERGARSGNKSSSTTKTKATTSSSTTSASTNPSSSSSFGRMRLPDKLLLLLNGTPMENVFWWIPDGNGFAFNTDTVQTEFLDKHFGGTKLSSFVRSLNRWGFRKVFHQAFPPHINAFYHPKFKRANPLKVKEITMASLRNQGEDEEEEAELVQSQGYETLVGETVTPADGNPVLLTSTTTTTGENAAAAANSTSIDGQQGQAAPDLGFLQVLQQGLQAAASQSSQPPVAQATPTSMNDHTAAMANELQQNMLNTIAMLQQQHAQQQQAQQQQQVQQEAQRQQQQQPVITQDLQPWQMLIQQLSQQQPWRAIHHILQQQQPATLQPVVQQETEQPPAGPSHQAQRAHQSNQALYSFPSTLQQQQQPAHQQATNNAMQMHMTSPHSQSRQTQTQPPLPAQGAHYTTQQLLEARGNGDGSSAPAPQAQFGTQQNQQPQQFVLVQPQQQYQNVSQVNSDGVGQGQQQLLQSLTPGNIDANLLQSVLLQQLIQQGFSFPSVSAPQPPGNAPAEEKETASTASIDSSQQTSN